MLWGNQLNTTIYGVNMFREVFLYFFKFEKQGACGNLKGNRI